jgi:hypothetical protein
MARNPLRILGILFTFYSLVSFCGCQESTKTEKVKPSYNETTTKPKTIPDDVKPETPIAKSEEKETPGDSGNEVKPEPKPVPKSVPKPTQKQSPPTPPAIPKVGLTDTLRATCLVSVEDKFPDSDITSADGSKVAVHSLFGENYSVVFLWSGVGSNYARLTAISALQDLQTDIAEPYAGKGVKVLAINVGDNPQTVHQQLAKNGPKISCYFDEKRTLFNKVAKSMLPRVYLLDAGGKIIWFDTEYSQASRRNLMQAVLAALGESKNQKN